MEENVLNKSQWNCSENQNVSVSATKENTHVYTHVFVAGLSRLEYLPLQCPWNRLKPNSLEARIQYHLLQPPGLLNFPHTETNHFLKHCDKSPIFPPSTPSWNFHRLVFKQSAVVFYAEQIFTDGVVANTEFEKTSLSLTFYERKFL